MGERTGSGIWLCSGPGDPPWAGLVLVPNSARIVKIDSSRLTARLDVACRPDDQRTRRVGDVGVPAMAQVYSALTQGALLVAERVGLVVDLGRLLHRRGRGVDQGAAEAESETGMAVSDATIAAFPEASPTIRRIMVLLRGRGPVGVVPQPRCAP